MKNCRSTLKRSCMLVALAVVTSAGVVAQDTGTLDKASAEKVFPAKSPYSPYAARNFPTRPYFGDTHLHTSFSMDAGAFGARLTPRDEAHMTSIGKDSGDVATEHV